MVRLKDIAERAGVSVMTVSKALRDARDVSAATRAQIKLLAQQMGYVPDSSAQGLRTRTTKLFGVVIPTLASPVFAAVVQGIQERASERGFDVLIACTLNSAEREENGIRRLLARRADGIFVFPVYRMASEARMYQELAARKAPAVLLGHPAPFCAGFLSVVGDDLSGAHQLTQHLLQLGHKRIAFLAGPPATPWAQERLEGYRRALREAQIEWDDGLVFQAGQSIEDGAKAAAQLLSESTAVTAIQAVNDMVALGCAELFLKQGLKIPEEVSIVGFDDAVVNEHLRVPLTSVRQPKYRLGVAAVDLMVGLLQGNRVAPQRLANNLVIRASSGIAPATVALARGKR